MTTPIILDVDTGIDDALAIALAVKAPNCDLVAMTTVAGNIDIGNATRNTLDVLDMLGATDVPVHRGASRPLVRPHKDAAYFHGLNGIGGAKLPRSTRSVGPDRGPAAIIRHAAARPGEITLVCTGPLTNLAIALNVEPELPNLLKRVVLMGGAYQVPGNTTKWAEYNIFCDPEAAAQVFETPFPDIIAIGLDVTHQCKLPNDIWHAIEEQADPVARLFRAVLEAPFAIREQTGFHLHDPLALGVALDPTLVTTGRYTVSVHAGSDERGSTSLGQPALVNVATAVDHQRFLREMCETLGLPLVGHDRQLHAL